MTRDLAVKQTKDLVSKCLVDFRTFECGFQFFDIRHIRYSFFRRGIIIDVGSRRWASGRGV